MMRAVTALLLAVLLVLPACKRSERTISESFYIFGTIVEVVIRDGDEKKARAAAGEVGALFGVLHRDWHAWKSGGELSRLNEALGHGRSLQVSARLADLIKRAKALQAQSEGLFDPAIGKVIAAWGFHSDQLPQGAPPGDGEIASLLALKPSMADVDLSGDVISSRNSAVQLDFGGFAKGAAIDLAIALLKKRGIGNAIVNAGGDLNVLGDHGARQWRIAIRDPVRWGAIASLVVRSGEAVYTSGNYERYLEHDGLRFSHIIDPRSFRPVREIISATVVHTDGALADAAATALSVAGRDEWQRVARSMGVDQVLLIGADGEILMTNAMKARIHFEREKPGKFIVSETRH